MRIVPHFLVKSFPHPSVAFIIFVSWLMLHHRISMGHLLLALLFSWLIPQLLQNFIIHTPNMRWIEAIKLFFVVLWDIIRCNIQVAKLVLGSAKQLHPQWFRVPLDTDHEQVNSLLAMIITTTPGTVTAGIDQQRGDILVHSLNTHDIEAEIVQIKTRYEQPLMRIFNADQTP